MQITDTASLLVFLASPALITVLSPLLDKFAWFQSLSSNGKLALIVGISTLLSIASVAAQQAVATNPSVLGVLDPYIVPIITIITFATSQLAYGMRGAAATAPCRPNASHATRAN